MLSLFFLVPPKHHCGHLERGHSHAPERCDIAPASQHGRDKRCRHDRHRVSEPSAGPLLLAWVLFGEFPHTPGGSGWKSCSSSLPWSLGSREGRTSQACGIMKGDGRLASNKMGVQRRAETLKSWIALNP